MKHSTLCLKKVPTFKLSVTLSIVTDFQNFCTTGQRMKFAKTQFGIIHLTLGVGELKIQIFCRYSAHMEENANKLHFKCTDFKSSTRLTAYSGCILVLFLFFLSLNTMLTVDKHCCDVCCGEFPVPQIDRNSKQVKTVTWKILFAISIRKNSF